MVYRIVRLVVILFALVGLGAAIAGVGFLAGGISARPEPSRAEAAIATRLRSLAIPSAAKRRQNPVPASREAIDAGMAHWADHCASCHGNNGKGDTEMGRGLYPRAPDMTLPATQTLSDGTLFYVIEQGVKLTGMPAWGTGTPEGEEESWKLVHFIRYLPKLTPEDIAKMEGMNPKSPANMTEEEEMRRFLEGEGPVPKPGAKPMKHGGHK